jgi:predicted Zn-dependent protease
MLAQALKSLRAGEIDAALATIRDYLDQHPQDADGHHLHGVILRAAGDFDGSAASIDRAIELAPQTSAFHLSRASLLLDRRDLIRAKAELGKVIEADPNQLAGYLMLANFALASSDLDEADRLLKLALRVDPEHPQVLILKGQLLAARGDNDASLAALTKALDRAPNDPLAQVSLGLAYLKNGHFAFAAQLLEKAVAQKPEAFGLRWALIRALKEQDRLDETLVHIEALLAHQPDNLPALALRGDIRISGGNLEGGLDDYRRTLDLSPQRLALLGPMLGVLLNRGLRQPARDLVEEQLQREPLNDALWQGRVRLEAGDFAAQVEIIRRWSAALPDSTACLEALAQQAELQGDLPRARELAERAVAGDASRASAEFILIRADIRDDPASALPRLERAFSAAQGNQSRRMVLFWEGIAFDRLDQPAEAVTRWSQMLLHQSPGLPLPVSAPQEAENPSDDGPAPKLMWTVPGSRPDRLAALFEALPVALTADRFGNLPRADGLGPVKALDEFGQPAEPLPTWRRLLADRGLDPATVVEWIPNWDERLAGRLPGSRLLALVRDPRDLLLAMALDGAPQNYQVPSFDIAAAWLVQALEPLVQRVEAGDPSVLMLRTEDVDRDPHGALDRIGAFFEFERPAGAEWSEPRPRGLGGIPLGLPDGRWQGYAEALAGPFAVVAPLAARLGY